MNSKLIYLDTNIWNRLIDQDVSPQKLVGDLASKDANLALSGQTVYELSRTFLSSVPNALVRARDLFRYLKQFVDAEIPCAHDNMEQLHGEISAMNTGASDVIAFYGPNEYALLRSEVEKLSQGICDTRAEQFIAGRKQFSESTRSGQKSHFQAKQHVRNQLKLVSEDQLHAWLDKEMLAASGTAILTSHLLRMYESLLEETAILNAHALLRIPPSRIAKGIVRADLYFNWRCANRGSNPKDLADDLYHVLNSSYCAVYATAEPGQAEYASLVLTERTKVAIYNDQTPVDAWLRGLI
jgi:hypothetical protein